MGNIRVIQPTLTPSGNLRGGNPSAGPDVSGLVRGVDRLADADAREQEHQRRVSEANLERIRREADQAYKQQQQDEARISVLKTVTDAQASFTERLAAAQESAVDGAPGFTASMVKEFDTWQEEAAKTVPELGRKVFELQALQLKGALHSKAFTFEQGARHKKLASDFDSSLDSARRTVWADPSQFPDLLARHMATAKTMGVSEELRGKMAEIARDRLSYDAAAGMTERDPNGVLTMLGFPPGKWQPGMPLPDTAKTAAAVKHDPIFSNLPPEKLQSILHRALSLSASQDGAAQRLSEDQLRDAEKAVKSLQEFTLSGALASSEYGQQTMALVRGTPFEGQARALLEASVTGAAIGSQPLARQAQIIRSMEETAAKGGSDPEQQKVLAQARTINATQRKAYEENPWQAASTFARLPPTPEANIGAAEQVPQLVQQRLAAIGPVETAAGQAVSPLQPAEAVAFAAKLATLPPDTRAEVLGATGAQLTAPRILALAEQLDKKDRPLALSLKLGADRTTAGRATSALVLRGAQALADKRVKRDDTALSGWRSEISTIVRGTLGDPAAEQDAIDAAYFVRAAMDADGSAVPGHQLDATARQAVKLVMGDVMEREGVKTVLPRGMDEGAFTERVRTLYPVRALRLMTAKESSPDPGYKGSQAAPSQFYVRGRPVPVESFAATLPGMSMRRDAAGRYIPVIGNAFVTTDAAGTMPLALEVR